MADTRKDSPAWQNALLEQIDETAQARVRDVITHQTSPSAKNAFEQWMDRFRETELARPYRDLVGNHEFGGHLRPLFVRHHLTSDGDFIEHCKKLFAMRRQWVHDNLYHGYCDSHEVHHEPETFLFFQIPLLDLTGDPEILEAINEVAEMTGNWAPGVPEWYDWDRHEFRSTWLGSRNVRDRHPYNYQEANHWRIIAIALTAHRHGKGSGKYLDLAQDYAYRWLRHIHHCVEQGGPITMHILPEHARVVEMGRASAQAENLPDNVYRIFFNTVSTNTTYDLGRGLQDVYRLAGDERLLDAVDVIIDQFRHNAEPETGRWALKCISNEWITRPKNRHEGPPVGHAAVPLMRLVLRQESLRPNSERRRDLIRWAQAVLPGNDPSDAGTAELLFTAFAFSGDDRFLTEGYRRITAALASVFDVERYHCCATRTRSGIGFLLESPLLAEAKLAEPGTRGSWPFLRTN